MAERRMFTQKITESDAFLEMPASSQILYFHLCMNADDDGFVSKPRAIMRCVGAKDDDARILIAKKFIIPFDNGVIVIKHWRMHNLLRKDRYVETSYKDLKSQLFLDENGAYTQNECAAVDVTREKKPLTKAQQKRLEARHNGDLPYSFDYKIRQAFIGETCPICGIKMGVSVRRDDDSVVSKSPMPTVQHNIPISKGGTHTLNNISVICQKCNYSIQDNPTGKLNNDLVVEKWEKIENGTGMETEDSIVEDSIVKDSIVEDIGEKPAHEKKARVGSNIPPTLEEVSEYCKERENGIDPERFVNYYTANGWKVGKVPMKNWQSAIRLWERNSNTTQGNRPSSFDVDEFFNAALEKTYGENTPQQ